MHAFWDSTSWQKFVGPCRAVVVRWNAECVTNAVGPFRHVHARLNLLNSRGAQWFKSSISARRDKLDSGIIKRPSDSIVFEETKLQANDDVVKEWEFTLLWSWLMNQVVVLEASQSQIGVTWKFGSSFANLCRSLDFNRSCLHAWIYWVSQMCHEIVVQWRVQPAASVSRHLPSQQTVEQFLSLLQWRQLLAQCQFRRRWGQSLTSRLLNHDGKNQKVLHQLTG